MKIERDVPLPDGGNWRTGELGALLRKMEVGDSVMVENAIPQKLGVLLYRTGQDRPLGGSSPGEQCTVASESGGSARGDRRA